MTTPLKPCPDAVEAIDKAMEDCCHVYEEPVAENIAKHLAARGFTITHQPALDTEAKPHLNGEQLLALARTISVTDMDTDGQRHVRIVNLAKRYAASLQPAMTDAELEREAESIVIEHNLYHRKLDETKLAIVALAKKCGG